MAMIFDINNIEKLCDYGWVQKMMGCKQSPIWHPEGDVWTHTKMVLEYLISMPEWKKLDNEQQNILFAAAVLHDVGKPYCSKEDTKGDICSNNHAQIGSILARRILWDIGVPFSTREKICSFIRFHMRPIYVCKSDLGPLHQRKMAQMSLNIKLCDLSILSEADQMGRGKPSKIDTDNMLGYFRLFAEDLNCWDTAYPFYSDHTRLMCFLRERPLSNNSFDDTKCKVIMMVGLPGSGKDTWIKKNASSLPMISLDEIRNELHVKALEQEDDVMRIAKERSTELLRQGQDFIWNATCLTNRTRRKNALRFNDYKAKIILQYVEVPHEKLILQNKSREAVVPDVAMGQMIKIWEVPDLTEAHTINYHVE